MQGYIYKKEKTFQTPINMHSTFISIVFILITCINICINTLFNAYPFINNRILTKLSYFIKLFIVNITGFLESSFQLLANFELSISFRYADYMAYRLK